MKKTGQNIKRLRKEANISVRELQEVLCFKHATAIYNWERGVRIPSIDNLLILAKVFDVTIDEIIKSSDL